MGHESGLVILVEWLVVFASGLLGLCDFWLVEREPREEENVVLKIIFKEIIKMIIFKQRIDKCVMKN